MAGEAESASKGVSLIEAHRSFLADPALQTKFEGIKPPENPPKWVEWLADLINALAPFLSYLFWAGICLLVAVILYAILNEALRRLPRNAEIVTPPPELPVPQYRPAKIRALALLAEADLLAQQGRFGEAVRIILHRSVADLEDTFPGAITPSLTSREISFIKELSGAGRNAFVLIARAVEASLFAGRDLNAHQYQECRAAYESFAVGGHPA